MQMEKNNYQLKLIQIHFMKKKSIDPLLLNMGVCDPNKKNI